MGTILLHPSARQGSAYLCIVVTTATASVSTCQESSALSDTCEAAGPKILSNAGIGWPNSSDDMWRLLTTTCDYLLRNKPAWCSATTICSPVHIHCRFELLWHVIVSIIQSCSTHIQLSTLVLDNQGSETSHRKPVSLGSGQFCAQSLKLLSSCIRWSGSSDSLLFLLFWPLKHHKQESSNNPKVLLPSSNISFSILLIYASISPYVPPSQGKKRDPVGYHICCTPDLTHATHVQPWRQQFPLRERLGITTGRPAPGGQTKRQIHGAMMILNDFTKWYIYI